MNTSLRLLVKTALIVLSCQAVAGNHVVKATTPVGPTGECPPGSIYLSDVGACEVTQIVSNHDAEQPKAEVRDNAAVSHMGTTFVDDPEGYAVCDTDFKPKPSFCFHREP